MRSTKGFSLIEALIALLVIAIGLMGIAALQAATIYRTHTATLQGLAAIEAQSIAAKITANQIALAGYNTTDAITVTAPKKCTTITSPCSPADMADYDLFQWGTNLDNSLPQGKGQVACTAIPAQCTISVSWWQRQAAAAAGGTPGSAGQILTYSLVMRP